MQPTRQETGIGLSRTFLSQAGCDLLASYCASADAPWLQTAPDDVWTNRTIPHSLARPDIRRALETIRDRLIALVMNAYDLKKPLYADSLSLTRWRAGDEQGMHADSENMDGSPHPYPWRNYGAIIYLNTDFEGGEIYFPLQEITPPITPGMLAFFPGTLDYLHGVTKVTSGTRYTLATFLTHDIAHRDAA